MFRHLVVTGRSRLAIYLARIPAGLAIVVPLVAIGFTIVCTVCAFAAPTKLNYHSVPVPPGLSRAGLENWAGDHPDAVICNFSYGGAITVNLPCLNDAGGPTSRGRPTPAQLKALAVQIAEQDYSDYTTELLYPSFLIKTGLWMELEAVVGFIVGLGFASLLGQRMVAVVLMIVFQIVLTPIFALARIPHLLNLQRAVVGLATAHLEPSGLPVVLGVVARGSGPGGRALVPESTTVAVCVVVAWLVGWTIIGAWRMMTRDA